ncbi:G-patch domain protein [Aspergillus sclerotialis]|uniref:G-patch domain protein n=1 Tax=Aspergillus sclerotialis TaxID=2070753 RepID=A0A3A2ZB27_9EURO|nr:G-patch domain protein [Aspergillus sclerotialis]
MSHVEDEGEDYFIPLEDQRVFGAGIRRKRVPFIRSSEHELNTTTSSTTAPSTPSGTNIANKYLSIVLPKDKKNETPTDTHFAPPSPTSTHREPESTRCEVCNLPISSPDTRNPNPERDSNPPERPHEASLAHQLCLTHSHPPSHLDRTSHGLRYLSAYGWDPDSRVGLGAPGREGILQPLKPKAKNDTVGLGVEVDSRTRVDREKAKVQKLNAKQVRKGHAEMRKRGEKLREMFYQNDDVQRYLGGGG